MSYTKKIYCIIGFAALTISCVSTQKSATNATGIMQSSMDKTNNIRALSYERRHILTFFPLQPDTAFCEMNVLFDNEGKVKKLAKRDIGKFYDHEEYYIGDTLYSVNLVDSSYSAAYKEFYLLSSDDNLFQTIRFWKSNLDNQKTGQIKYNDTIVDGIACYNIAYSVTDTILHSYYRHRQMLLDKKNLLPVQISSLDDSKNDRTGYDVQHLKTENETDFYNYKINNEVNPAVFNFDKSKYIFQPYSYKQLLPDGATAPDLSSLSDLSNNNIDMSKFKGKVLLVVFQKNLGLARQTESDLNYIYDRYDKYSSQGGVAVLSVCYDKTPAQIQQYYQKKNIEYPCYIGNKYLINKFHALATPCFYLIDKNNKIVKSFLGTKPAWNTEICNTIDSLLKK